jgi:hypothetical protein
MPRTSTWKDHERRTAAVLRGQRLGATGAANPDVIAGDLCIECKHRDALPAWLTEALAKVRKQAGRGRLGLVVLHEKGKRDSLVVLSLVDFAARYGAIPVQDD